MQSVLGGLLFAPKSTFANIGSLRGRSAAMPIALSAQTSNGRRVWSHITLSTRPIPRPRGNMVRRRIGTRCRFGPTNRLPKTCLKRRRPDRAGGAVTGMIAKERHFASYRS